MIKDDCFIPVLHSSAQGKQDHLYIIIIQIFISTKRHELADHIFCIPMSNCLIADTEVPENAHMAYRVKFLLNEMIMSKIFWM